MARKGVWDPIGMAYSLCFQVFRKGEPRRIWHEICENIGARNVADSVFHLDWLAMRTPLAILIPLLLGLFLLIGPPPAEAG
jgi:hypothetical protein